MQHTAPIAFTDEIKSLFVEKKLLQARERLLQTLSNNWDGHCNLIAFTFLYAEGRNEEDCVQALHWLEQGVARNEVDAKVILGRLLLSGEAGPQDFPRGMQLLEQAAQANVLMAVLTLARASTVLPMMLKLPPVREPVKPMVPGSAKALTEPTPDWALTTEKSTPVVDASPTDDAGEPPRPSSEAPAALKVLNASFMPATAEKALLDSTTGVLAAESATIEKAPVTGAWAVASTSPTVA